MDLQVVGWNDVELKTKFDMLLSASDNDAGQRKIWNRAKIEEVLNYMKNAKNIRAGGGKLTSMDYYWIGKYDRVTVDGKEHITFKKKNPDDPTVVIIPREEFYDVLKPIHIGCGHGGRDKMLKIIKKKFYIPKKAIEIFNSLCSVCENKRGNASELNKITTPRDSFNVRGLLDVLDFQFCPDGEYKWLLKYQEHSTNFFHFCPLKSNEPKEVATELLKIFLTIGPPTILQSLTGQENIADILKEIKIIWPQCKTINGSSKYQFELEKTATNRNNDIVNMLLTWMSENNVLNWSVGCYFYQYHLNTSVSAYKKLFCREHKQTVCSTAPSSTENFNEYASTENMRQQFQILSSIPSKLNSLQCMNNGPFSDTHNNLNTTLNTNEPNSHIVFPKLQTEIKIEFDNSELPPNQEDSNSETYNDSHAQNFNIKYVKQEFDSRCHKKSDDNFIETTSTNSNATYDVPMEFFLKTELIEEDENVKMSCAVCQNAAFIVHTVCCFNCNDSIHKTCGINVTDNNDGEKTVLCYKCLSKRFPEFKNKVPTTTKGRKRRAPEAVDNTAVKKAPNIISADKNEPGPSHVE